MHDDEDDVEQILHYGFDDHGRDQSVSLRTGRGTVELNEEIFFSKLYVDRLEHESKIRRALDSYLNGIAVLAPAGSGKTSCISRTLRTIKKETGAPYIRIDFKGLSIEDSESLEAPGDDFKSNVREWLMLRLHTELRDLMAEMELPFLTYHPWLMSSDARKCLRDRPIRRLQTECDLLAWWDNTDKSKEARDADRSASWYEHALKTRFPKAEELMKEVEGSLDVHCLSYIILRHLRDTHDARAITIFLDNTDSLASHRARTMVCNIISRLQPTYSPSLQFIIAARPENYPFSRQSPDTGAHQFRELRLDHDDAADWPGPTTEVSSQLTSEEASPPIPAHKLDRAILHKRLEIVQVEEGSAKNDGDPDSSLVAWIRAIESQRDTSKVLRFLANWNRKEKPVYVSRFARFLQRVAPRGPNQLGTGTGRQIALSSLLYSWIARLVWVDEERHHKWFRVLRQWQDGPDQTLGCVLPYMVLAFLRNHPIRGSSDRRFQIGRGVTFQEMCRAFRPIKVDGDELIDAIHDLRSYGRLGSLIDIDLDESSWRNDIDLLGDERGSRRETSDGESGLEPGSPAYELIANAASIRLNPRGCVMVDHVLTRFFFFHTLHALRKGRARKELDEHLAVRKQDLESLADTSLDLVKMTDHALDELGRRAGSSASDWFTKYRENFCISVYDAGLFEGQNNLLLDNVLSVMSNFWSQARRSYWPHGNAYEESNARSKFDSIRDRLRTSIEKHVPGDTHGSLVHG